MTKITFNYFIAFSLVFFSLEGFAQVTIESDKVGIGIENFERLLHIHAVPSSRQLRLSDSNGFFDIHGGNNFEIIDDSGQAYFFIDGNAANIGNVGIGTASPSERLHVEGDAVFVPNSNSSVDLSVKITRTFIDDEFDLHILKILPQGDIDGGLVTAEIGDFNNLWSRVYTRSIDMGTSLSSKKILLYNTGTSNYGMGVVAGQFRFNINGPLARYAFHDSDQFNSNEIFTINGNGTFGFNDPNPTHTLTVNGNVTKPGGGSWIVSSDKKLKTNIQKFALGLDIIKNISPKTFQYNGKLNLPTEETYIGVIAQDLQKVAPFMVSEFEKEGNAYLAVDPSAFDYILINAVKEMTEQMEQKEEQIEDLKLANAILETRLNRIELLLSKKQDTKSEATLSQPFNVTNAQLYPNQPNPFSKSTTICYFIPETVKQADLQITDTNGKILKIIPVNTRGEGQSILQAQALSAGTYFYTLILDGQILETKQMILTN